MQYIQPSFLLRLAVASILLMHSIPGMFDGGITTFGTKYLDAMGFAPMGLALAWAVKLSHVACALSLLVNRYVKWVALVNVLVLIFGIFMIHLPHGWFVVGGGVNGVEFNVLLIAVLLFLSFPSEFEKAEEKKY